MSALSVIIPSLVQALSSVIPEVGKLLLDKNPSLTVQLPVWLRVFPELRVVVAMKCQGDPVPPALMARLARCLGLPEGAADTVG